MTKVAERLFYDEIEQNHRFVTLVNFGVLDAALGPGSDPFSTRGREESLLFYPREGGGIGAKCDS